MNCCQKSRNQMKQPVKLINSRRTLIKHTKYANQLFLTNMLLSSYYTNNQIAQTQEVEKMKRKLQFQQNTTKFRKLSDTYYDSIHNQESPSPTIYTQNINTKQRNRYSDEQKILGRDRKMSNTIANYDDEYLTARLNSHCSTSDTVS